MNQLRERFPDVPIVGTVPAIKLAAKVTKNKKIGLLATNATVKHPYCKKLVSDFASGCEVFNRGDPDLISFIEHDLFYASKEKRTSGAEISRIFRSWIGLEKLKKRIVVDVEPVPIYVRKTQLVWMRTNMGLFIRQHLRKQGLLERHLLA